MSAPTPGRWPVVLSGRAIRELRLLSEDKRTLEIIRTKLKELSHGQFTTDNCLPIRGTRENIPIYRARLSNDLRIVYLIDLVSDAHNQFDYQVIKVFSVSSRARVVYNFWVKVSKYLVRRGDTYRDRCKRLEVSNTPNGPINVPTRFLHADYVSAMADAEFPMDAETNMAELHETIVLEKFTPVTKSLYNCRGPVSGLTKQLNVPSRSLAILADMEVILPMALNPDEKAIVRHHGTSIVVGRSGTGKTTALIYKMRANAQMGVRSESLRPIRQLFVTRSKVLTQHIASNYRGLVESSEIAFKTAEELEEMRKANKYQNRELVEFDNEVDLRDDLPRRFSQLTDANFPLFVSFDKLCTLLEADIDADEDILTSTRVQTRRRRLTTFSDFKHRYWPEYDYRTTRLLDPALVYSEILGVIKGYGRTMSREEYLNSLSHKRSPLLAEVRPQVYTIFEAYTNQLHLGNEIDAADRTQGIWSCFKSKLTSEQKVDYLFVDEVQDLLMADVYLLKSLCSNPDGEYWCGDTAQTINIGSSFRIKDLKAYIYESMLPNQEVSHRRRKAAAPFSAFELTVNFRSHGGIVKYAASLVELIYTLFPSSIDHMKPESASSPGKAPILFFSPVDDEASFVSYLLDGKPADQAAPFGAQQAIIVRSESTAKSLTSRLQKRCTVLSLRETKGLEFDDLILYNFFAESEASTSAWRVILGLNVRTENGRVQYQREDLSVSISPVLCSELKQLYVAVTRARHRCWLWDSGTTIDLMKVFWERLGLIAVSDSLAKLGNFAASSKDLRQWALRGQEFFSNGLYALAVSCFERAGQDKESAIADAYQHMSEAKLLPTNSQESKDAFIKAAEKMQTCAECSDHENSSHSSATLWYHAATCFEAAKAVTRASQSYCNAKLYDRAALVSFEAQDMDGCLAVLLAYGARMDPNLANKVKEVSSVYFLRERKYSQLRKLFDGSLKRCIEFARSLKFGAQLKELLHMNRQFKELADVHLEDGSPVEAIHCLRQNFVDSSTVDRSRSIVSTYLWANFGLDAAPDTKSTEQAAELITISRSPVLPSGLVNHSERHDIELFDAILSQSTTRISLDLLQNAFHDLDQANEEDEARIILIRHHVLKTTDWISGDSYHIFFTHLQEWHKYASTIKHLEALSNPCQHNTVRRLLALSNSTSSAAGAAHSIHIPNGSFLQGSSVANRASARSGKKSPGGGIFVTPGMADQRIRAFFAEHMKKRLLNDHPALFQSPWTQISSPWKHNVFLHLEGDSEVAFYTSPSVQELIRSLSLVFQVMNQVKGNNICERDSPQSNCDSNNIQISWITRLFNVIFPETGSITCTYTTLAQLDTPNVICTWVSEGLELLDPTKHVNDFPTLLVICLALASELDPNHVPVVTAPRMQLKNGPMRRADLFTEDLCILFQRDSSLKFSRVIDTIERLVDFESSIDLFALVHLIEQAAREVIFSVRASTGTSRPTLRSGFSGLIMPLSWAASLAAQVKQVRVLQILWLNKLLGCAKTILQRLSGGLPDPRKPINNESQKHTVESLAVRLHWTVCFVVVNLRPGHPSLPIAFDVMKTASTGETYNPNSLVDGLEGIFIDRKFFSEITSQQSCLSVLSQTFQHEDLVMLSDSCRQISLAKQYFVRRVIPFKDLDDLRTTLGVSAESIVLATSAPPPPTAEPTIHEPPSKGPVPDVKNPPQTQTSAIDPKIVLPAQPVSIPAEGLPPRRGPVLDSKKAENLDTRPTMTLKEAVLRLQAARSRRIRKLQPPPQRVSQLPDFAEGQLYELYDIYGEDFPKLGKKAWEKTRDRISWRLVRGPCLYIVLALRMLVDEIDEYVGQLDQELQNPGLDPNGLADIQLKKTKVRGQQGKVNELVPIDATPKLLEADNLAGVRTQAGHAWNAFMLVKNSGTLPQNDTFKAIERLASHGRNIVLDAAKRFGKSR